MRGRSENEPLDIARGLENLAKFIKSAGFYEAGDLVAMAARSAWDEINRILALRGKVERPGDNARGQ